MPFSTLSSRYRTELRTLNLFAAAVHFALAVAILIITAVIGAPFTLFSKVVFTDIPHPAQFDDLFLTPNCTFPDSNVTTLYTDVFLWLDCVTANAVASNGTISPRAATQTVVRDVSSIPVWTLIFVFEVVTCCAHLYLVRYDQQYHLLLEQRLQPVRWLEYSITNTIMLLAILSLSGTNDVYVQSAFAIGAIAMNFAGGLVFELLDSLEGLAAIDAERRKWIRTSKFGVLIVAWAVFVLSLVYIFDIFYTNVVQYEGIPTASLFRQLFDIIQILNIGIVILYSIFPALHLVQHGFYISKPVVDYITIEKGYIVASLISKSFLSITVFVASVQRA